jgi:SAM-dependent methyltransferase
VRYVAPAMPRLPYASPVDHAPLEPGPGGLVAPDGRVWPEACGGWDLRPPGMSAATAAQAEIFDAMAGEPTDFDHPHNLTLVHQRELLDRLELRRGDRVLEIGGHRSGVLPYLERHHGIDGHGVDIAPAWVAAQNRHAEARGSDTKWVLGDAEALPFADRSFRAVVAFDVLEHIPDLERAVAEVFRVLADGGLLVCHLPVQDITGSLDGLSRWRDPADFAARQASVGHFHERMPTRTRFRTLLEHTGFHVEDVRSFNVWVQPIHDYRILPALGRLRHRFSRSSSSKADSGGGGASPPQRPPTGASGFQKAYAATVIPLARALATPDRLGAALGFGGSASFVARRGAVGGRAG